MTVEIPKGAVGKPALKSRGRTMAPEVANYTDKAKLQRCKPDFMLTNLTSRKTSTGASAAGTISPREGHGQLFSMFKARSPVE